MNKKLYLHQLELKKKIKKKRCLLESRNLVIIT